MTDPIENLTAEHVMALQILDRLEGLLAKGAFDTGDAQTLKEINTFFAGELAVHLKKEEEALFPALEPYLGREGGPIGVMLTEHEDLRRTFELFKAGIAPLDSGADPQGSAIRDSGGRIIEVLRGHIHKEDHVLFRMAGQFLGEETLKEVGAKMSAMEEDVRKGS